MANLIETHRTLSLAYSVEECPIRLNAIAKELRRLESLKPEVSLMVVESKEALAIDTYWYKDGSLCNECEYYNAEPDINFYSCRCLDGRAETKQAPCLSLGLNLLKENDDEENNSSTGPGSI